METCLSSTMSILKAVHSSTGQLIHKAVRNELITLRIAQARSIYTNQDEQHIAEVAEEGYIKITIGTNTFSFIFPALVGKIAEDLPVWEGEDMWVTTSFPNKYVIFGTTRPFQ